MKWIAEAAVGGPEDRVPALDGAAILARLEGNQELLDELVELFFEDCRGWLGEIRAAIDAGDARRLKLPAHTLRGAAGYFRPCAPYEVARRLEEMADAGDLAGAAGLYDHLEDAIRRLAPVLRGLTGRAVTPEGPRC